MTELNKLKILNGNELLIQGGREAGFDLYTGYPGSPLADFFLILENQKKQLKEQGIKVVIGNSEANAAAMASGAKMAGKNVLVAMKSMGLHVAADALSVGNFANPGERQAGELKEKAGVVIAVGDDPWSISTSAPMDSRYLFQHLHIPFLEPATPQQLKDWMALSLELSQQSSLYVGILLTTFLAEGGGRVDCQEFKPLSLDKVNLSPEEFDLQKNVMVPPNSLYADKAMIQERFPLFQKVLASMKLNQVWGSGELAIISSGGTFEVVKEVLEQEKLLEKVSLYQVACPYPLDEEHVLNFLKDKKQLIVVEEKRGFLEESLKALIHQHKLELDVVGKKIAEAIGFPAFGGLNTELVREGLKRALTFFQQKHVWQEEAGSWKLNEKLPIRLPTFCPGCPHRETLSLLKDLRKSLKEKNINLISHGDVGCYSLAFLEPFKEMHDLSAMGQGGALGAGTDLFIENPSVVLMGDSTFFHSGMAALSSSIQLGHNITYILLDNDNTAMTGHQMTPRTGVDVEGEVRPRQDILAMVKAMGVQSLQEVNPSDRYFYKNLLAEVIQQKGVKVIISNKECALTFHGRKKREERKLFNQHTKLKEKSFYQINTFACEDCRECVEMTGCPGLSQTQDAYGTKVFIDPQICVSDGYCTQIKACPSFELVKVIDYHPTAYKKLSAQKPTEQLPLPTPLVTTKNFSVIVIGVGGSGVTTISRVLAEAALTMDEQVDFKFVDQKGLAQRNGSVTGHLAFFPKGSSKSATVALGQADLVLSPDLLEGSRALKYLKPQGTLICDQDFQIPLSLLLERQEGLTAEELTQTVKAQLQEQALLFDFKKLCFQKLGKSVYASAMILGATFQKGLLPFSEKELVQAFERSLPSAELNHNLEAFRLGRMLVLQPETLSLQSEQTLTTEDFKESLQQAFLPWQKRYIKKYQADAQRWQQRFPQLSGGEQFLHDLYLYDLGKNVLSFFKDIEKLQKHYEGKKLQQAVRTLARTYFVKDEVFVAHQLISPLKTKQDQNFYQGLGKSFQVQHINRPAFEIAGKTIEFDLNPRDWMLKLMRHGRFLRKLLPAWHRKERNMAQKIRKQLLQGTARLQELENIKGYREVRYKLAAEAGL